MLHRMVEHSVSYTVAGDTIAISGTAVASPPVFCVVVAHATPPIPVSLNFVTFKKGISTYASPSLSSLTPMAARSLANWVRSRISS